MILDVDLSNMNLDEPLVKLLPLPAFGDIHACAMGRRCICINRIHKSAGFNEAGLRPSAT